MRKKLIICLIAALVLCSVLAGCGDGNDSTEPETTNTTNTFNIPNIDSLTLQEFNGMSYEQQMEIVESFETPDEYHKWIDELVKEENTNVEQQNDPTDPTEATKTTDSNDPTEATNTTDSNDPTDVTETTDPTLIFPENPDVTAPSKEEVTYLDYHAMSGAEQKKFINSFASIDAFIDWHNAAKQAYFDSLEAIDGTTPIHLGD